MGDMKLYGDTPKAVAGAKFGLTCETETFSAGERIYPGDPCFGMTGEGKVCYGAHVNAVSLIAAADLVAGNSVAVTINGIAVAPVAFDGSSANTVKKIIQTIDLNDDVRALGIDAFGIDDAPRGIFLSAPGVSITASAAVTGGASQTSFSQSAYTNMKFVGVARHQELSYREGTGFYPPQASVNVQTSGKVWVPVADGANPGDKEAAYIVMTGADAGKFTDSAAGGAYDSGCVFRSEKIEGGLALIEVRGMK